MNPLQGRLAALNAELKTVYDEFEALDEVRELRAKLAEGSAEEKRLQTLVDEVEGAALHASEAVQQLQRDVKGTSQYIEDLKAKR